ncbi:lysozyme inhibitor LprI family protein [Massilia antarctica]|uniref:lysozyme inhibitor LprI family protein n=1 Tax=Massilia antarctica TaxID=2765360 RepID=UPI00226F9219|nr:lysozyme inhibitor LprI family protein [Massilia sp. H27-R4]MCY0910315.1 lysozyme inhibitor LprI family protein [Massilia sp. H27-R4]
MKRSIVLMLFASACSFSSAASFDCALAATTVEKTICADDQLSLLDSQLAQSYMEAKSSSSSADLLKSEQRAWLATVRNKCADAECLRQAYTVRIAHFGGTSASVRNSSVPLDASMTPVDQANQSATIAEKSDPLASSNPSPVQSAVKSAPPQDAGAKTVAESPSSDKSAAATDSVANPGMGVSEFFQAIFGIGLLVLVAGMVRPSIAAKWIAVPTRMKIFGWMLLVLVPVAGISSITKSSARIAYEGRIADQRRTARLAEQQAQNTPAISRAGVTGVAEVRQQRRSRYQLAVDRFVSAGQKAVKVGATTNPSCNSAFMEFQEQYLTDIGPKVEEARRAYGNDVSNLSAFEEAHARILDVNTSSLASICGI